MNSNEITYWSTFYKQFNEMNPSGFACFIMNYLNDYKGPFTILDVGCGNGRDSYYLSSMYNTTGIDISVIPTGTNPNLRFIQGDMINIDKSPYNVIYSRFTFHSITNEQQDKLIQSIADNTILCIETRSSKDNDEYRTFGDTHYRNLTDMDYLLNLLEKYHFTILYSVESKDVAVYKEENPTCIRIICKN
jgi:tellurite methyltransferase